MKNINLEQFSSEKEYYEYLKNVCLNIKMNNQLSIGQDAIKMFYPLFRNYKIELEGVENIPTDTNVLFVLNHSTSHDIFTAYEFLSMLNRRGSVMVATDCLNPVTTEIFNISNATLLDRRNKEERRNSVLELSQKIINGNDGVIFGEGSWNLHPTLPMHVIQNGASKISLITKVPIIPTIVEYVEVDDLVKTDAELYKKCVIRFGKPINQNYNNSLIENSSNVRDVMTNMRKSVWADYGINRSSIECVDPIMYVNHTYAKKFKAIGFTFNSEMEEKYLLFDTDLKENEYTIDENGEFKPGITKKKLRK